MRKVFSKLVMLITLNIDPALAYEERFKSHAGDEFTLSGEGYYCMMTSYNRATCRTDDRATCEAQQADGIVQGVITKQDVALGCAERTKFVKALTELVQEESDGKILTRASGDAKKK